jgi:hypothetical protein
MDNVSFLPSPTKPPDRCVAPAGSVTLARLCRRYRLPQVSLERTREGRNLSRARYRRAEEFMAGLVVDGVVERTDLFYFAGIVVQLALSSHLLDVGFPDAWCARHVGLHVGQSLAYANATGLGCACDDTARLAAVLSPYWKWNRTRSIGRPLADDGGFEQDQIRHLLTSLLAHVADITGHTPRRRR